MTHEMRRKEKSIPPDEAELILANALVGRLGTSWNDEPYIVPLNFAYDRGKVYFHCANRGKKIEFMLRNPAVCFEVDDFLGIKGSEKPCSLGAYYRSVIAFGNANIIKEAEKKEEALKKIVNKYAKSVKFSIDQDVLDRTEVVEITVEKITGKQSLKIQ
jgi:nitroimidazol reductase NimA-like FMN-containing flavoprotein (pyridoxamine 5'-phosphate oxidase superfamily)